MPTIRVPKNLQVGSIITYVDPQGDFSNKKYIVTKIGSNSPLQHGEGEFDFIFESVPYPNSEGEKAEIHYWYRLNGSEAWVILDEKPKIKKQRLSRVKLIAQIEKLETIGSDKAFAKIASISQKLRYAK